MAIGGGAGGGGGFRLGPINNLFGATSGDASASPLVVSAAANRAAAEGVRDAYFTANSANLAEYDANPEFGIYLFYTSGGDDVLLGQTRAGNAWVTNATLVAFRGQDGTSADLSGVPDNAILVNDGGSIAASGLRQDGSRVISDRNLETVPSGLLLGDGQTIAAGIHLVQFIDADNERAYAQGVRYDDSGNVQPFYFKLAARSNFVVATVADTDLPDPASFTLQNIMPESLIRSYTVVPATSGTLTATAHLGTDNTGPIVAQNSYTIDAGDIGSPTTLEIPNPSFAQAGDDLHIVFSGVQLRGGLQSGGLVDGQTTPSLSASIQLATRTFFLDQANVLEGAGVTLTVDSNNQTLTIAAGGQVSPSVHNFSINIPARVDIGEDLNTTHTISFSTAGTSEILTMELIVTDGDNVSLTVPQNDGNHQADVPLSAIDTSSAGSVSFLIRGTTASGVIMSNQVTIQIANAAPHEFAYYGAREFNDFATVDLSALTSADVTRQGSEFTITQVVPDDHFIGILVPDNRDLVSLVSTVTNTDSLNDFTKTNNVRTIGGQAYNLYVEQNNSGFSGTFNLRARTE